MDSTGIAINHHFDPFKLDFLALLQQTLGLFNHEASEGVAFALGHLPALFVQFQDAVSIKVVFWLPWHCVCVQKTVVDLLVVKLVRGFLTISSNTSSKVTMPLVPYSSTTIAKCTFRS